jgi:hypothetical protein
MNLGRHFSNVVQNAFVLYEGRGDQRRCDTNAPDESRCTSQSGYDSPCAYQLRGRDYR